MARHRLKTSWASWRQGIFALLALLSLVLLPGLAMAQGNTSFNHDTTQFSLRGAHEIVRCETCHLNGVFKGTPKQCSLCHVQGSKTDAMPMSAKHIPVTEQCDVCHNTSTFSGTQFTHAMVAPGSCDTCHNNYYAQGKSANHPATTASCDVCHTIGAFLPVALFDHAASGIFAQPPSGPRCDSCHNNTRQPQVATGKSSNHVPVLNASTDCDACHLQTTSWRPALFDHAANGINNPPGASQPSCTSCHNGTYSLGKPPGTAHIPTTLDCEMCHNSSPVLNPGGFSVGQMNHTGITTNCAQCHAANTPYPPLNGQPVSNPNSISNHIPFGSASCETCHANAIAGTFVSWAGAVMNHAAVTSISCQTCHEDGANYAGLDSSTKLVMRSSLGTHIPVPLSIGCSSCHGSTTAFTSSVNFTTSGTHSTAATAAGCNACHADGMGPFAVSRAVVMPAATASLSQQGLPHVVLASGSDCGSCHVASKIGNFAPGGNGFRLAYGPSTPSLNVSQHSLVSGSCASCHQNANFAGMVASTDTQAGDSFPSATLDKVHQTFTGDCGGCHTTAPLFANNAFAGARPTGHIPIGTNSCDVCHGTSGVYSSPDLNATHTAMATQYACTSCHNSTQSQAAKSIGGTSPNIVYVPTNHIPIASLGSTSAAAGTQTCDSAGCHQTYTVQTNFKTANGGGAIPSNPSLSPDGHASVLNAGVATCTTCHESTSPNYLGMLKTIYTTSGAPGNVIADSRPPAVDQNHPTAGDCGACHTTQATFAQHFSASAQPTGHIPVGTATCFACHANVSNAVGDYSIANTHSAQSQPCATCHNPTVAAGIQANATALGFNGVPATPTVYIDSTHIPVGSLDCKQSGCHNAYGTGSNPTKFLLGAASPTGASPTLNAAGHALVASTSCVTCHSAGTTFLGMDNSTAHVSDAFPASSVDPLHQNYSGGCDSCHTTAPNFNTNVRALPPKHLPVGAGATCIGCHTTVTASASGLAGGYGAVDLTATHSATSTLACTSCHSATALQGALVAAALSPKLSTAVNHIPFGSLDCAASGCHAKYSTGGSFLLGTAVYQQGSSLLSPAAHLSVAAAGVTGCTTCHNAAGAALYAGMLSSQTVPGDQAPSATVDAIHFSQYTGECSQCHTTTATFGSNAFGKKPTGHVPTGTISACTTCHAGGVYTSPDLSASATHGTGQACAVCHNPTQSAAAASIGGTSGVIVYNGFNNGKHIPVGTLGNTSAANGVKTCDAAGCHDRGSYTTGAFVIGSPNVNTPTLNVTGHSSAYLAGGSLAVCTTCHETGTAYQGMIGTTMNGTAIGVHGDTRPGAAGGHVQASSGQDCGVCHSTAPNFANNFASGSTVAEPAGHIPSAGANCSACHGLDANGNFTGPNIVNVHTATSTQPCALCHNQTVSQGISTNSAVLSYNGVAPVPTVYADATHFPFGSVNCLSCHATYTSTTSTFKLGAPSPTGTPLLSVSQHALVASFSCVTCHSTGNGYKGLANDPTVVSDVTPAASLDPVHQGYTSSCDTCHTTASSFNTNPKVLPPNHLPTGTGGNNCISCHTTVTTSGGGYTVADLNVTHADTTSLACTSCHSASVVSVALVSATQTPKLTTATNHIPIGSLDCKTSGCHDQPYSSKKDFIIGTPVYGPGSTLMSAATHALLPGAGVSGCAVCHTASGTPPYAGMLSSSTTAGDQAPSATLDNTHYTQYTGECSGCHSTTPTFGSNASAGQPKGHIPTGSKSACTSCHAGGVYTTPDLSTSGTHGTGQACAVCHNPTQSAAAASIGGSSGVIVYNGTGGAKHIPIGSLGNTAAASGVKTCDGAGCHNSVSNYASGGGGFKMVPNSTPSFSAPTLSVAGHSTVAGAGQTSCTTCHEAGTGYQGMLATVSSTTLISVHGDTRPSLTNHPQASTGQDCGVCHSTAPNFGNNFVAGASGAEPTGHIPTGGATCTACHTTDANGNFAAPDITKTHTAATASAQTCATCHNASVSAGIAGNASNLGYGGTPAVPTVYNDGTHFPIGTVDCASSGCHKQYGPSSSTTNTVFLIGAANPSVPTLAAAGHTSVSSLTCTSCHGGTTTYKGMAATTAGSIGDMVPGTGVDPAGHKFTGDCGACHATTGLFNTNVTTLPPNHLPTGTAGTGNASCTTCHTSGNYVTMTSAQIAQTHTSTASLTCLSCHSATVTATALSTSALMPKLSTAVTHIPFGALDCAASGCHGTYTTSVTSFFIGAASINTPTLSVAGHTSVAGAGVACGTCHTNASGGILYTGMVSSSTTVGDQFPSATVDANHPAFQAACGPSCHTTTAPTFSSNNNGGALPTGHIPSTAWPSGAFPACSTCHIGGVNNVAQMSHTGLTGGCVTCHGATQLSFLNVKPKAEPANHVPTNVAGMTNACEACHRNVQTGNFSSFAGTVMDHAGISTSCISCHAVGKAYYGVTMVNPPNGTTDGHQYVATKACETCHTNKLVPGGFLNGKFVHSALGATAASCLRCHEIGAAFTGVSGLWVRPSTNHNAGQDCGNSGCHNTQDKSIGTGTTAVAGAVLSPTTLVLSSTAIGTSVTKPVVLVNSGTAALTITSIALSGTNATDFSQTNTCGTSLAVSASCVITVSFKPTAAGNRTATVTLTDNAGVTKGTSTQTIALTGAVATTTLSASTAVALTSTGIKPATSPVQSLLFKNVGTTSVTISSVTITGTNASDFVLTNGCTAALPATTGSCSIGIAFSPVANLGVQEVATLNIVSNGFPSTFALPLNGSIASTATAAAKRARIFASAPRQGGVSGGSLLGGLRGRLPGTPGAGAAGAAGGTLAQVLALPGAPATPGATPAVPGRAGVGVPAAGQGTAPSGPSGIRPVGAAASGVRPVTGLPPGAPVATVNGVAPSIATPLAAGANGAAGLPTTAAQGAASAVPAPIGVRPVGPGAVPGAPGATVTPAGTPTGIRPAGGALQAPATPGSPVTAAPVSPLTAGGPAVNVRAATGAPQNHAGVIPGACATCHNGRGAPGLPKNHMLTNRSCDQCHNTAAWTPVTPYRHNSPKYQPHDASVTCISCHKSNMEMVVTPYPQYGTSCASCHANQFRPQQHRRADRPNQFFTAADLQDCAGACHLALPGRMGSTPPMFAYHRSSAPAF